MKELNDSRQPLAVMLSGLLIVAAGSLAYSNTFNVPFLLDDIQRISANENIRSWWPPSIATSDTNRPLAIYTFALNYQVHGYQLWGYHLTNLAIHLTAGLFLFGIVRRTLLRFDELSHYQVTLFAAVSASLWVLHPLNTQAVTYIVQRLESLMGMCYLATLYFFVRAQDSRSPVCCYVLSLASCAYGMGCKEVMISAPLIVLWYDRAMLAESWSEIIGKRKWYYAGLCPTWSVLLWAMFRFTADYTGGFIGSIEGLNWWTYLLSQAGVLVHYLRLSVIPFGQCFDYGWPIAGSVAEVWWQGLTVVGLMVTTVVCIWKRKRLSFIGACFFLILAPTSSVVPIKDIAFEHRMYLPLSALVAGVVCVVGIAIAATDRLSESARKLTLIGASATLIFVFGGVCYQRNQIYQSEFTLWSDVVQKAPENPRGQYNLSVAYLSRGNFRDALKHSLTAIRLNPSFAKAHNNAGTIYLRLGNSAKAQESFRKAIESDPELVQPWLNLGNLLVTDSPKEAERCFREAIRLEERYVSAYNSLGYVLMLNGDLVGSIDALQRAVEIQPKSAISHYNLADAYARKGDLTKARQHHRSAAKLDRRWQRPPNSLLQASETTTKK